MEKENNTTPQRRSKEAILDELKLIEKLIDDIIQSDYVHFETALYAYLRVVWVTISNAISHIDEYGKLPDDDSL